MNSKDKNEKNADCVKPKTPKKKRRWRPFRYLFYDFVKVTGAITALLYVRPKCLYESAAAKKKLRGKGVIIANHLGVLDPIILHCVFYYRRLSFLTLDDIFKTRLGKFFFSHVNCIPVDRGNFSMQTFKASLDVLERNKPLCIYPEGHINQYEDKTNVAPFKSGAVLIAVRGKAPIIPVYVAPRKKWYHRTVCVIGEPIDVAAMVEKSFDMNTVDEINDELHEKEMKLREIHRKWEDRKKSSK